MKYKLILPIVVLASVFGACNTESSNNASNTESSDKDSVAITVRDEKHADLWAYLYGHEFVRDSFSLTFSGDKGYLNDERVVDALVVSECEEQVAALVGINPRTGKKVRLAVVMDGVNNSVVDMTDKEHIVFYIENQTN